jgi:hypothetical protein
MKLMNLNQRLLENVHCVDLKLFFSKGRFARVEKTCPLPPLCKNLEVLPRKALRKKRKVVTLTEFVCPFAS